MAYDWNQLAGTYWYVPQEYLPAISMGSNDTEPAWLIDQTVWQITGAQKGYFWGNCAALVYPAGTEPDADPSGLTMVGTATPNNAIQISFLENTLPGSALATTGFGIFKLQGVEWVFEMQMATGLSALTLHWALMYQCYEGSEAWNELPGVGMSVPEFLAKAGFQV